MGLISRVSSRTYRANLKIMAQTEDKKQESSSKNNPKSSISKSENSISGLPDILTLEIQSPTTPFNAQSDTKTLKIQVSPQEIVQELHSILQAEYPETCHRTCFSLFFNGERLDAYAEI